MSRKCLIGAAAYVAISLAPLAAQQISYEVVQESGISGVTISDPRFSSELLSIQRSPRSRFEVNDFLKSYVLIVKNDSSFKVIRTVVRFELSFAHRPQAVWVHNMDTGGRRLQGRLPPGQSILMFPGVINAGSGFAAADAQQLYEREKILREATRVAVILDAVFLDSGVVLGPDKSGSAISYRAEQEAVRILHAELERRFQDGGPTARFQDHLEKISTTEPQRTLGVADRARDAKFHYQQTLRTLAQEILFQKMSLQDAVAHLRINNDNLKDLRLSR